MTEGAIVELVAISVGGLILLVPLVGFTVRFALKPLVESLRSGGRAPDETRQIAALERRLAEAEQAIGRLEDVTTFDRLLETGERDG